VVRLDAGDGRATHPYVDYYYTVSLDGGRTWPKMQPMAGTGCARPRPGPARGASAAVAFPTVNRVCTAFLCGRAGRAGRLTVKSGF
jgi:hypothetical protein